MTEPTYDLKDYLAGYAKGRHDRGIGFDITTSLESRSFIAGYMAGREGKAS